MYWADWTRYDPDADIIYRNLFETSENIFTKTITAQ
jgi:uncharacterized protein YuzE